MELYQLRQFQSAARHKNMTRAAGELCIAQPALSKTIHKLEEEFGAQLFIRNKKGLECTRQGEILLEYADRILALSEDAARAVSESLGDAGEIRLCLRSSAVLVSNVLKDFIHEHPHVSFSISSEPKGCDLLIDSQLHLRRCHHHHHPRPYRVPAVSGSDLQRHGCRCCQRLKLRPPPAAETGSNFWHRKRKAVFGQYSLFKTSTFFLHHLLLLPVSVQEPGEYSRRKTNNLLLQEFIL